MSKILLIATGGTIASRCGEHGLRPALVGEELRAAMGTEWDEIETLDYLSLDSCNIIPAYWEEFAREIDDLRTDYDGFIITHGTDTMAYTSAALYYMLEGIDRPVVLTGSQRPLGVSGSDAKDNLRLAHRVALSGYPGVVLAFGGRVIRGNAAKKLYTIRDDAFRSIGAPEISIDADTADTQTAPAVPFRLRDVLDERVAVIKLYPGIPPDIIRVHIEAGYRGLIIEGFGSGGVPLINEHSLLPALVYARDAALTVVLTTQCIYDGADLSRYEVGVRAAELGVLSGGALPVEALYPLLMLRLTETPEGKRLTSLDVE